MPSNFLVGVLSCVLGMCTLQATPEHVCGKWHQRQVGVITRKRPELGRFSHTPVTPVD
jgi:hypothetical protein